MHKLIIGQMYLLTQGVFIYAYIYICHIYGYLYMQAYICIYEQFDMGECAQIVNLRDLAKISMYAYWCQRGNIYREKGRGITQGEEAVSDAKGAVMPKGQGRVINALRPPVIACQWLWQSGREWTVWTVCCRAGNGQAPPRFARPILVPAPRKNGFSCAMLFALSRARAIRRCTGWLQTANDSRERPASRRMRIGLLLESPD